MSPSGTIAAAVRMAEQATDPDERQRWVDEAHSALDRWLNGETQDEPEQIAARVNDPRRAAIEGFFASHRISEALAQGSVTIDLTESECERCGSPYELTTTEIGRVVCHGDCPNPAWQHASLDTPPYPE